MSLETLHQPKQLKLGIILDAPFLAPWVKRLFDLLSENNHLDISVVVRRPTSQGEVVGEKPTLLYRWYSFFDEKRGRFSEDSVDLYTSVYAPWIREKFETSMDVLLNLGEEECSQELFEMSRYGVWQYHHGDATRERGRAAGFWEVFDGRPVSEVALYARQELDGPFFVLSRTSIRTHPTSPAINRKKIQLAGVSLVHYALTTLLHTGIFPIEFFRRQMVLGSEGEPLAACPGNLQMFYFMLANAMKVIKGKTISRGKITQWAIGVTRENPLALSTTKFENIRWLLPDRKRFLADPFFVEHQGKTWIFVEDYNYASRRGHIAVTEFTGDGRFLGLTPVLKTDFHLSFPFVFSYQNGFYMLPEQSTTGKVVLYESIAFPEQWREKKVLLPNFPGVDNALYFHNDYWWLFTSYGAYGNHDNNLHLFYSKNLFDEFLPHPENPVKLNLRGSRMAGAVFWEGDRIIRPAQNCSLRYGGSVVLYEITKLSPTEFEEREIKEIRPSSDSPFSEGFHTVNSLHDLTAVAGYRFIGHIDKGEERKVA